MMVVLFVEKLIIMFVLVKHYLPKDIEDNITSMFLFHIPMLLAPHPSWMFRALRYVGLILILLITCSLILPLPIASSLGCISGLVMLKDSTKMVHTLN